MPRSWGSESRRVFRRFADRIPELPRALLPVAERVLAGMSAAEIAAVTGLSVSTVRVYASVAKGRILRRHINPDPPELPKQAGAGDVPPPPSPTSPAPADTPGPKVPPEPSSPLVPASHLRRRVGGSIRPRMLMLRQKMHEAATPEELAELDATPRPRTRGECTDGPRPCPWVSCVHHLYLDVTDVGTIKLNFPHLEVGDLQDTCALDVADRGGGTLEEVGAVMNVTRERIRQLESRGLAEMKNTGGERLGLSPEHEREVA